VISIDSVNSFVSSILGFFPLVLQYVYITDAITVGVRGLCYPWAILGGACIVS
jgi:hypothetical protein